MSIVKLYSYFRSSASWRVRIALELKDIKYEYIAVNLVKNEQYGDTYTGVNQMGQLPTIVIDEFSLSQSIPIMEYLDEKFPDKGTRLLPNDSNSRAVVRQMCEIINSGIQPLQNLSVIRKVGEGQAEWANFWITKGFAAFEKLLEEHGGKYCFKDEITMADACLIPQLYGAERFKVDMTKFPKITEICNRLKTHKAFIEGDAFKQPDCPEDLRK